MSSAARPHFAFGVMIAAATVMLDQASKLWIVRALDLRLGERIVVTPFLDFVLALNIGISYGLFPQGGELGRWSLVALKLSAAALFTFWMAKATSRLTAAALALLVGGALGNAIDRVIYGAVVDFISLHAFGWRWYVFNLADAAIVAGVAALLYDALAGSVTKSPPSG